ncbi:MAG: N-6 DNA methylase [Candidatus Kapabacteria bacterium]|nr:N-6 DNA methylase [Candidatus Kapabacteria bacterium]
MNAEDRTILLSDKTISKQCLSLGNYEINEYTKIGIFEVELNEKVNITRNRVALRNLIKDITKQVAGAMVVFVQGDKWRFSYISKRKIKNKDTNQIQDKETAPKRYTYLFGKGEKALTAAQRFDKLIQKQKGNFFDLLSLDDFEDAFSVEKLSKEFFDKYKEVYEDFVEFLTGKRYVKKGSKWTEITTHEAHFQLRNYFGGENKHARDFVKRMLGRIVFLYFIQKKGWLAVPKGKKWGEGNPDYLFELFDKAKYKESFYSDYLVPLFFDTLNNPGVQKESNELRFPYLNGGLFDKSQDYRYDKIALPSEIFEKLFTTFNNYNFTIHEDAPDEHTVAVDPEMLGHIFENLLEDNKDKGAFYTPKEIVHYMCKESLKEYLLAHDEKLFTGNEIAVVAIEKIIQQQELSEDEKEFAEKNAYTIIAALDNVKICDPAIGSGAFPMGLLQEIFNAQIYLQELKGFKKGITDAEIKKHIIEESIYGVDIDAGAVDIARLRFWLSLVVDEEVPQPLPNLAFKIVCANTLIPLSTDKSMQYQIAGATDIIKEIEKVRHSYFDSSKEEKKELERQFKNLQNKLWNTAKDWVVSKDAEIYQRLLEFNPFEDKSCSWFDPWWMFGVKDGFDIVIGNPPYVDIKALKPEVVKILFKLYPTAINRINLYSIFIEKAYSLLNKEGTLAFIVPNSLLINDSYAKIRKHIINDLRQLIKLPDSIFENAIVETIILLVNRGLSNDNVKSLFFKNNDTTNLTNLNFDVYNKRNWEADPLCKFNIFKDNVESSILNLIEKDKTELINEVYFSLGITPYDKAKGHSREQIENRVFHSAKKESDDYVPLIAGKNIRRFSVELKFDEFLKYGNWLGAPRDSRFFTEPKIIVRQILDGSNLSIIAAYSEEAIYFTQIGFSLIAKENSRLNLKYILAILNSRTISFYHKFKYLDTEKNVFPKILIANCKKFPIPVIEPVIQSPFVNLVDYIVYLNDKLTRQISTHTANERIASHLEDVLNMMVYELYFEEHMKTEGIDVLQFIFPKPIADLKNPKDKEDVIQDFYLWYQKPENPVRQRMLLVETRSKDIIAVINKSLQ